MDIKREDLIDYVYAKLRDGPKLAEDHIFIGGKRLKKRNGYFRIETYAKNFIEGYNENRFTYMPGLRGIGKTTILFQLYDYLVNKKGIEEDRILYVSVDELCAYFGTKLINVVDVFINDIHQSSPVNLDKELFILVDESHYDKKWSLIGKILYDKSDKIFMIFTGSSALCLEMNADASRRAKNESIYPMNFSEYLLLKHGIHPPTGTSGVLRDLIFNGDNESVSRAAKIENHINRNTLKLEKPLDKEWENFLCNGGFPFGTYLDSADIYDKIFSVVDKVIQKDVFLIKSFKTETATIIFNIILFLALQDPGETSSIKLASKLEISSSTVKNILDVLEKTHLIFNVLPYGNAGKKIGKPWKYYFLSPSVKAAINFKLGKFDPNNRKTLGILTENLVASSLFRMKKTIHRPQGIFYATERGGVDFLLTDISGGVIPVEVGIGKKKSGQVFNAIDKYNSDYGILISNATKTIQKKGDIIYIPPTIFSFI